MRLDDQIRYYRNRPLSLIAGFDPARSKRRSTPICGAAMLLLGATVAETSLMSTALNRIVLTLSSLQMGITLVIVVAQHYACNTITKCYKLPQKWISQYQ